MPVHKKQDTTPHNAAGTQASLEPAVPEPENFQAYLRGEIRQATRIVMEKIMREELTQFLGATWGESTPERKGYRNGFYARDLRTTNGPIEDLKVRKATEKGRFKRRPLTATAVMNHRLQRD